MYKRLGKPAPNRKPNENDEEKQADPEACPVLFFLAETEKRIPFGTVET
jgi:hypothetical protein